MTTKKEISKSTEIEYNALKAEQRQRISTRDNMLYLQIASLVALLSIFEKFSVQAVFIMAPFISLTLGWKYYINDIKISEIAAYFRNLAIKEDIFLFEIRVRGGNDRNYRKMFEFLMKLVIFIVPIFSCNFLSWIDPTVTYLTKSLSMIYNLLGIILVIYFSKSLDFNS